MQFSFKKLINHSLIACLLTGILIYLAWHTLSGDRSLTAYSQKKQIVQELKQQHHTIQKRNSHMDKRNSLLRDHSISQDMLEEEVHKNLGYYHPDEIIIR